PFIAVAAALLLFCGGLLLILPKLSSSASYKSDNAAATAADDKPVVNAQIDSAIDADSEERAADMDVAEEIDSFIDDDDSNYGSDRTENVSSYEADPGTDSYFLNPVNPGDGEITSEVHIAYSALDSEAASVITALESREDIEEDYGRTLVSFYVEDVPYGEAVKYDLCEDSDGSSYVFVFEDDDGKRIVPANEDEYELLRQLIDEQAANSILYIYMSEN
ncbi:MAG: hypothetical protein J5883_00420, partial [Clostridiales bacterium]|nr:hypothetical protein [Clostridiales bacterium]